MARPAGLILDYGNVLAHPRDETWMDRAARRLGAGRAAFRAAYWQHRHAYDADLPAAEYWRRVLAASRPGGGAPDAAELAWLIAADVASWRVYHDEVWALAAAFRAAGGRTGFLSNNGPEVMARVRADHPLEARFDAVVISCESASPSPIPGSSGSAWSASACPPPPPSSWTIARTTWRPPRGSGCRPSSSKAPTRSSGCGPWSAESSCPRRPPPLGVPVANLGNSLLGLAEGFPAQPLRSPLTWRFAESFPVAWLLPLGSSAVDSGRPWSTQPHRRYP